MSARRSRSTVLLRVSTDGGPCIMLRVPAETCLDRALWELMAARIRCRPGKPWSAWSHSRVVSASICLTRGRSRVGRKIRWWWGWRVEW